MKKLEVVKAVAGIVVSLGAGAVVGNAIKFTSPEDLKVLAKVGVGIGGFVISAMVGDAAAKYTEEQIDSVVDGVKNATDGETIVVQESDETKTN